jgi:alpha-tubulin suppressor-like RCC1 family protein
MSCSFHADKQVNCVGDGIRNFVVCGDMFCSDGTEVMPALDVDSVVDLVHWWGCHADASGVRCFGHASYHPMGYNEGLGVYVSDAATWPIPGVKGRVIDLGIGATHGCALIEDGRVYCWGVNRAGQLGRAKSTKRSPNGGDRALLVSGLPQLVNLDGGDDHTCGLDAQGTAWCWGSNEHGQLGGSPSGFGVPVSVPDLPSLASLHVGDTHACGLDHDARVWCWGDDREGQLGDGPGIVGQGPRVIEGLPAIRQLSTATATTCAVDEKGEVWCWGLNESRQASTASPTWSLAAVEVDPSRIIPIVESPPPGVGPK